MKKLEILVVDDDERSREILKMILEYSSHIVIAAPDAETAINMLKGNTYDLVMTDLQMPGINGLELARWIKEYFPATKVILVTGYQHITPKDIAADRIIFKPYDTGKVREIINNLFEFED
jgi:CheY-like chemotaxis protein